MYLPINIGYQQFNKSRILRRQIQDNRLPTSANEIRQRR